MSTTLVPRQLLVPVSPLLWSSHAWEDGTRARLCDTRHGDFGPANVIDELLGLRQAVADDGGCLYVIQLRRSWEDQQAAHDSGRSPVKPGYSTHQSGNGADLEWRGITDPEFFELAKGRGWTTVEGDKPHWEWHGIWARLFAEQGPGAMAMAMFLDQGLPGGHTYEGTDGYGTDEVAALQAQIWRVLPEGCGAVDGFVGELTLAALDALVMAPTATYEDLYRLCSAAA